MAKILKTSLQVVLVTGKEKKTKTFANAVAEITDEQAQKLGEIIASLAPEATGLEQVKSVETKTY